jgi:pilus assembly protein Flp/PilA
MNKLYLLITTLFGDLEERADSLRNQAHEDRGAAMVEYGLLVALIAVVVAIGAGLLGLRIDALFDTVTF